MPTKRKPRWLDRFWLGALALVIVLPPQSVQAAPAKANASKARVHQAPKPHAVKKPARVTRPAKASSVSSKPTPEITPPHEALRSAPSFFGAASFYGYGFQGRKVATGERFDVRGMTAACNHVPLGTWVAVRREDSGRCVVVKVNDRMHTKHRIRVIDLSRGAAEQLRMIAAGVVMVRVAPLKGMPGDAEEACLNAFSPLEEGSCPSCNPPERAPELPNLYELMGHSSAD